MSVQPHQAAIYRTSMAEIICAKIWGKSVYFTITNPKDVIQKSHVKGRFYEEEELEIIRKYCRPGMVFCDIGSNIGNHALFALTFLNVAKVILFEPNPNAVAVLRSNLMLNGVMDRCDDQHLGLGLSDSANTGLGMAVPGRNMGAGRMVEGAGDLEVIRGDDALADQRVDFIKMDVEGMEMRALAGLEQTIARNRPIMFIEVDRHNYEAFDAWVIANRYQVADTFKRYPSNQNYLVIPQQEGATSV